MKIKKFNIAILLILMTCVSFVSCVKESKAQEQLINQKDSIVAGVDTVASITLSGGYYVKGGFTITNATVSDTLKPQALFYGTTNWVTTSVKNVRLQTSDTNIITGAATWPVDFEINDPCIIGFRLVKYNSFYSSTRKSYIYFRFRRD